MQKMQVQSLGWEDPLQEENGNPLQYSCLKNPTDITPRSCCLGSGQFWGFLWGTGVTEEEVQPCPQLLRQSGPCLLRWAHRPLHRALPPSATAFLWQLLPTPRRGLQPRREASPSRLWLAVRPASAQPAVRFPIRE